MSAIEKHFAKLNKSLDKMKAEIKVIEREGHTTINGAIFLRFTELETAINRTKETVEQHINYKEKKDGN